MPVISIIVPVYKVEKYLCRCLDSIIAQTFTDFECILIDDGSPDNCPAICDEYAQKDSRFVVIHQENAGVSAARNAGLDRVRGDWVGFVDSDDCCEPEMFQVLYENAVQYNADVSICNNIRIIHNNRKAVYTKGNIKVYDRNKALLTMFTHGSWGGYSWNKLVKSKLFFKNKIRYDKTIKYMEDVLLFYKIFKQGDRIVYSSIPLYNYFWNPYSITAQSEVTAAAMTGITAFDKMLSLESNIEIKNRIIAAKVLYISSLCKRYIKYNCYTNDFYYLKEFIVLNSKIFLLDTSISLKGKCSTLLLSKCPRIYRFLTIIKNRGLTN